MTIAETLWRGISAVKLKRCQPPTWSRWCMGGGLIIGLTVTNGRLFVQGAGM
nr:MAG TPA: hypothetical protein [Caudoviricetes sp.]